MKPLSPIRKALAASFLLCASLLAPASGLITEEAASVIHMTPARTAGTRGKQLATLESYLYTQPLTIGIDGDADDMQSSCLEHAMQIWSDAIPDSPFVLARPGQKPMVLIRFVSSISSGGDVQGQVEATRMLHWGDSVSYKIDGTILVRKSTGRRDLRDDEITEVMAHEMGHLLGLDDAEECVGLMGPFVPGRPRMKPSREEVQAVIQYRDQLRQAIARLNK